MTIKIVLIVLVACFANTLAQKVRYDGYKLLTIFPKTETHFNLIDELQHQEDFDLWSRIRGGDDGTTISLSPEAFEKYALMFKLAKIEFTILRENLQEIFDEEERLMQKRQVGRNIMGKFARYSEVENWLLEQADKYSSIASTYIAGKTDEERNIRVMQIKTPQSKRKVWIDCGIHAREWISPSTCIWIIGKLLTEYDSGVASTVSLLNYYEIHVMPLLNPDGYEFTHTNTRLWRKNRKVNSGSVCYGVDLNRNFGHKWMTGGSSALPCTDTYAGPTANSENETMAVINAINAHIGEWDAYLTIHTYGKWLFTPYGYTAGEVPPEYDAKLLPKAKSAVNALQAVYRQTGWTQGSSSQILYIASGGSEDWTYGVANIIYSYCFELRPGQNNDPDSTYGFTLPEDRAPLAGEETYQGIKKLLDEIILDF